MFGAGGAARAIGVELALAGAARILVVNRSTDRGIGLTQLLTQKTGVTTEFVPWSGDYRVPGDVQVLINATSVGLFPDLDARVAVDIETLRPGLIVADVIPNPPKTRLLREAAAQGCHTIDGLGMLVNQGVLGIEYWTGITPDAGVMRRALEEVFGG
jgi:shikimate dehydrogenase